MTQHETSRTLVKSAPELWAECSDAASLARHLGAFGEIRITKLEPETAVAWEGTAARGTVTLEPSGWGTRVTLTLTEEGEKPAAVEEPLSVPDSPPPEDPAAGEPAAEALTSEEPVAEEPVAEERVAEERRGLIARLLLRFRGRPVEPPEPVEAEAVPPDPEPEATVDPEPAATVDSEPAPDVPPGPDGAPAGEDALAAALDSLGRAHHRPYSRS